MDEAAFSLPVAQEQELQIEGEELPSGSRTQELHTNGALVSTSFHSTKDVTDQHAKPGQCGLYNLGNTCFMNSGLQSLLSTTPLVKFFLEQFSVDDPHQDILTTNFHQIMRKFWSGHFSIIYPKDFKNALALFHTQFQDFRQHDCQEFLALFLDTLHQQLKNREEDVQNSVIEGVITSAKCTQEDCQLNNSVKSLHDLDQEQEMHSGKPCVEHDVDGSTSCKEDQENVSYVIQSELPTLLKSVVRTDSSSDLEQLGQEPSELRPLLNNASNLKQNIPKIEEFYAKDTKTLNTNVLSSDFESETLTTDSEKFPKQEMNNHPVHVNELGMHVTGESLMTVKDESPRKGVKATNILADKSNKVQKPTEPNIQNESKKKMKFECAEKNFQYEAMSKINKDFDITEQNLHLASFGDEGLNLIKDLGILGSLDSDMCETVMRRTHMLVGRNVSKNSLSSGTDGAPNGAQGNMEMCNDSDMESKYSAGSRTDVIMADEAEYRSRNIKSKQSYYCGDNVSKKLKMEVEECSHQTSISGSGTVGNKENPCVTLNTLEERDNGTDTPMEEEIGAEVDDVMDKDEVSEKEEEAADRAWDAYVKDNHSIIVSSFQGQFKSTVICSECSHISVTYEPFMYLSVPLPHASDRQLCVFFVSCQKSVTQYLLTLTKSDKIGKVKDSLKSVIKQPNCDVIMAEVLDHHISRVLEDNVMLRYVNDSTRKLYAFEMLPAPDHSISDITTDKNILETPAIVVTSDSNIDGDIFSNMGTFAKPDVDDIKFGSPAASASNNSNIPCNTDSLVKEPQITQDGSVAPATVDTESADSFQNNASGSQVEWTNYDSDQIRECLNQTKMETGTSIWDNETGHVSAGRSSPVNDTSWGTSDKWSSGGPFQEESSPSGWNVTDTLPFDETVLTSSDPMVGCVSWDMSANATSASSETATSNVTPVISNATTPIVDSWKSCAICLEELDDNELLAHIKCGGTLCHNCLEMSIKHYGEDGFLCPVCSNTAVLSDDFYQLGGDTGAPKLTRVLVIPIALRVTVNNENRLVGHPRLAYLPSNISGQELKQRIAEIFPSIQEYRVLMTDGQGLRCSRCSFTEQCKGCSFSLDGEINFKPGDCLTLSLDSLSEDQIKELEHFENHESMAALRPEKALTLFDCLQAFTDVEVLDQNNPWYCPSCQQNQCAMKTITVWQYPDILIIHLKRFVYHELSSTKVDAEVIFPLEDLNLSNYISGPDSSNLTYDLYSIVCHFGGSNAGHYTSFSKHPIEGEWYYYNDESVTLQSPQQEDFKNGYILFYGRQGLENKFEPPTLPLEIDSNAMCQSNDLDHSTSEQLSQTLNNRSQQAARGSPSAAEDSLQAARESQPAAEDSPQAARESPLAAEDSPQAARPSPQAAETDSYDDLNIDMNKEKVDLEVSGQYQG